MRDRVSIFPHERPESLLEALIAGLPGASGGPPRPARVVIPSLAFADWLQMGIAGRLGICMGIDFQMPQDFIRQVLQSDPAAPDAWSRRDLSWRILPHVGSFCKELGIEDPSPRESFALASLVADRLDQYGHFRPEIIRTWAKGGAWAAVPAEEWQRQLWTRLARETRVPHPAVGLENVFGDGEFLALLASRIPEVTVVGTGTIDPLLVLILRLLARSGTRVVLHVLLPSLGYLGGLGAAGMPDPELDPEEVPMPDGHPLLISLGRHAVGSFLLLGTLDEQYTRWPELSMGGDDHGGTLLARIQSDIRHLRQPCSSGLVADSSLRIHSCFSPRRELEVLCDELLRAFREIPELRPEDVHIVAPSLDSYGPLAPAIFHQAGLPVRLTELPAMSGNPLIEALIQMLDSARTGRMDASALLEFLRLPAVLEALGISDGEASDAGDWVRDSGLMRGPAGPDGQPGAWRFSRDRLVAGRWFGRNENARYPDGAYVLPVADQLGGDTAELGRFLRWHAALEAALTSWMAPARPSEWAARFSGVIPEILCADDDRRHEVQELIAFLSGRTESALVDAGAMMDWVAAEFEARGHRTAVSGRILFGSFKQLQNLPCRVLALVGLHDFPRENRLVSWDLLQASPRAWDRNPRVDDRQLFLDALLTPADRLLITGVGQNVRSGKEEPLSPCVDELLRVAEALGVDSSMLVVRHRLQPFSRAYFEDRPGGLPRSFDGVQARVAGELVSGHGPVPHPFWSGAAAAECLAGEVSDAMLGRFWKDPARAYLEACGLPAPREEEDDAELDRVLLAPGALDSWLLKSAILDEVIEGDGQVGRLEQQLRADRKLPPGELGRRLWEVHCETCLPVAKKIRSRFGGHQAVRFPSGGADIFGTIVLEEGGSHLLAWRPGSFSAASHFLRPWIQALIASCAGRPLPTRLLGEGEIELEPVDPAEAAGSLACLIEGLAAGQTRPIGFAAAASEAWARVFLKKGDRESANAAARKEWNLSGPGRTGEGLSASSLIAWRDRDAFEDEQDWERWGEAIAVPLLTWSHTGQSREL